MRTRHNSCIESYLSFSLKDCTMLLSSSPHDILWALLNMKDSTERAGQELENLPAFLLVIIFSLLQLLFIKRGPQIRGCNPSFLPRVSGLEGVGHSATADKSTSWELASCELLLVCWRIPVALLSGFDCKVLHFMVEMLFTNIRARLPCDRWWSES